MVLTLAPVDHAQTLQILEKIHIELLKQTLQTYRQLRLPYPTIPLSSLLPPYGKISSEHPYFPCHINVLFWETYQLRKHDRHFPIKHRLTLDIAHEIGGAQSSRFLGASGFPTLYKTIAGGAEDGATLISLDPKHRHPKLTHHQTHINVNAAAALKKLTNALAMQGIKVTLRSGVKEYHRFRRQLADKLYEHVGWPNTGGQKHLAASCLQLNLDAPGLAIDILSKSGAYTRLQLDSSDNPAVRHILLQHKGALEKYLKTPIPADYLIEKEYALLSLTYRRNETHELDRPWMVIVDQNIVHPEEPSQGIPVSVY